MPVQVHYASFDPKLLVSAGNDQNLLLWDQRQFEHHTEDSKSNSGGGGRAAGDGSGVSKSRKARPSGKKKGRSKGVHNKHQPAEADGAERRDNGREDLSGGNIREGVGPEVEVGSGPSETGETATEDLRDGIVRCSVPLLSVHLEEKPNWVTSFTVPYAAIAVADTSSIAKILRTHGS